MFRVGADGRRLASLHREEVFAILSDEQVHLVPGCHERQRSAAPADDGIGIQGQGPHDWEAVEDPPGLRIWVWREDPYLQQFCANAVLTMHRVCRPTGPC